MMSFTRPDLLWPESIRENGFITPGARILFKRFSVNAANYTSILPAVSNLRYRIHGLTVNAGSAGAFALHASAINPIFGSFNLGAGSMAIWPFMPPGWCQTSYGEALNVFQTAAFTMNGVLIYVETP